MKKNGYHGGATLQEMIVPVAVVSAGAQVPGWIERAPVLSTVVGGTGQRSAHCGSSPGNSSRRPRLARAERRRSSNS